MFLSYNLSLAYLLVFIVFGHALVVMDVHVINTIVICMKYDVNAVACSESRVIHA